MFDGLGDPMDFDPNTIQDWDKVQDMGYHAVEEGQATLGLGNHPPGMTADQIPKGNVPGDMSAQYSAAAGAAGSPVQGVLNKLSSGIKAGSDAKIAAQQIQLQQQLRRGAISQALFNTQMQQLQRSRTGFFQRNSSILLIGALLLVGGAVFYYSRRRRRY